MESILIMLLPLKSAVIIIQIVCIYDLHTKTTLYFLEEKKFLHKSIFLKNENEWKKNTYILHTTQKFSVEIRVFWWQKIVDSTKKKKSRFRLMHLSSICWCDNWHLRAADLVFFLSNKSHLEIQIIKFLFTIFLQYNLKKLFVYIFFCIYRVMMWSHMRFMGKMLLEWPLRHLKLGDQACNR